MEGFQINYTDLSDLFWEYKRKIENLIENIDNCIERINMFTENAVFTGKTGDAVKSYLGEAHITILSGIKVTAQTLLDNMAAYKDGYRAIDSSTNFKLDEEAIQEFRKKLASNYEDTDEYTGKIRSALSEVSDISDVGMPDSNGVFDIHEQMDSDLIKLVSNVNSYERENVVRLENSVELLLENLQSCLSKIGLSQGAIESYETGSFITGKDAATANSGNPMLEAANPALKSSKVVTGYLEGSNVQVADEMVNLIVAQRAYELNSKAITTADSMLETANNLRR